MLILIITKKNYEFYHNKLYTIIKYLKINKYMNIIITLTDI